MSDITLKDTKKIAKLARVKVSEEQEKQLTKQLGDIIHWVEALGEVDTENVEILTNVHNINMPLFEDKVVHGDMADQVLKNAPDNKYNYFAVPKVIE
ncbi:MAG: Asp-tRNA(Asn)/Glu-tRNA(Gln) amidotransferase subunit GatC [Proteobacteria bacterium]|nr:Asp-tRNA(Asn)/Glu-tRNA(Gln) amidotransferase subunit GatC [Pseudomonadota bacterium]